VTRDGTARVLLDTRGCEVVNRTRKNLTRITVAGSSVALLGGLAIPAAYACMPPESDVTPASVTAHPATLSVTGMKAHVDAYVAKRLAELSAEASKVAASTRLTTAQKAVVQARITAEVQALTALKTKVDGETTVAAIKADLAAAQLAALKADVAARIDIRLARLQAMIAKVQASSSIPAAKQADMVGTLQTRVAALTALKSAVSTETTTASVLADLRKAEAMWLLRMPAGWKADDGHRGDPATSGPAHAVSVHAAAWTKDGHRARDPKDTRVLAVGRGHASSCAGHHGFGGHHR